MDLEDQVIPEGKDVWGPYLAAAAYDIRATCHTTLEHSPGELVFGRDMILPIKVRADWSAINAKRQQEAARNNTRKNKSRIAHTYKVGYKVLLSKPGKQHNLNKPRTGPYEVIAVYNNGTLRIRKGLVTEKVNIRRVTPMFEE